MDCACLARKICGSYLSEDIFESGKMVSHEYVHIRKINVQTLEITEI